MRRSVAGNSALAHEGTVNRMDETESFHFVSQDGPKIYVRTWAKEASGRDRTGKGVVLISHGMMEHAGRYADFATALCEAGYLVYANDLRGHGLTVPTEEDLGLPGPDALDGMVRDMHQLRGIIEARHPGTPVFFFGHSLGSLLVQSYMSRFGDGLRGVVLCGTTGKAGPIVLLGILLARIQMALFGRDWRSQMLHRLTFSGYNKRFQPCRTPYDWLSRDTESIDKYVKDPRCGFVLSTEFFYDFARFLRRLHQRSTVRAIPADLPVFIVAGANDPVGQYGRGIDRLLRQYAEVGIHEVTHHIYPNGRHELLNDFGSTEVTKDIIAWLDKRAAPVVAGG